MTAIKMTPEHAEKDEFSLFLHVKIEMEVKKLQAYIDKLHEFDALMSKRRLDAEKARRAGNMDVYTKSIDALEEEIQHTSMNMKTFDL